MDRRLQLHEILVEKLGSRNVYFQPPASLRLNYPCITYNRSKSSVKPADNLKYLRVKGYELTVIDEDPDSEIPDAIEQLPMCSFDRWYTADNLNHYVFTIFY